MPQATMPKSLSRRAPRAVVKTPSRGPFREVEAVAKTKGGHSFMAKKASRAPSRVVEWTTIRGPTREGRTPSNAIQMGPLKGNPWPSSAAFSVRNDQGDLIHAEGKVLKQ
ncbi:hypothetical protein MTR67_002098 [Solanum verrucosum]|uniref:Uncharacterized protein n=1 Tax=Solanum verrucosum TaxID=315347 RepID=A0AAF0PPB7_SOLVR|nr:hypothetical protein MTR67_002098 [Solanum verrucosum]